MVKLVGLIPVLTGVLGRPEAMGSTLARSLRPEKLVNTGGRGPGGADMTNWDATNLLLGAICSDQVKDAATAVRRYRAMRYFAKPMSRKVHEPHPDYPGADRVTIENLCPEPLHWIQESSQQFDLGRLLDGLIGMARDGTLQALFRQLANGQLPADVPDREARISKAISLGMVYLDLKFQRPRPAGRIMFGITEHPQGPFLDVDFGYLSTWESEEELNSLEAGDLTETATITHRTIFALGEALRW